MGVFKGFVGFCMFLLNLDKIGLLEMVLLVFWFSCGLKARLYKIYTKHGWGGRSQKYTF